MTAERRIEAQGPDRGYHREAATPGKQIRMRLLWDLIWEPESTGRGGVWAEAKQETPGQAC